MVPAGNKTKRLSSVNHTTKSIQFKCLKSPWKKIKKTFWTSSKSSYCIQPAIFFNNSRSNRFYSVFCGKINQHIHRKICRLYDVCGYCLTERKVDFQTFRWRLPDQLTNIKENWMRSKSIINQPKIRKPWSLCCSHWKCVTSKKKLLQGEKYYYFRESFFFGQGLEIWAGFSDINHVLKYIMWTCFL